LSSAYGLALVGLLLLCAFSKFSEGVGKRGVYGQKQLLSVCNAAVSRASFAAGASAQDDSPLLALLHACEARAHALAAKDISDRCGLRVDADLLELHDDAQERIDALLQDLAG